MLMVARAAFAGDADDEKDYQKLLTEKSPALVTVKFVLKVKMGQLGDNEAETEVTAVMIDPKGLVLCSNTETGGKLGRVGRGISAALTDIRVLIGEDTQGLEAELMARDSELDLAWVKIKQPGDKPFAFIDFAKSARPRLGQRMLTVERMGKYFGRAARIGEMRVSAVTKKPRELIVPGGESVSLGLPVFTASGDIVGIGVAQSPASDDAGESALDSESDTADSSTSLILPADEVVKATARARESAQEAGADKSSDEKKKKAE